MLSFNLFNPSFPERLINSLTMIMKHRSKMGLTYIRHCLSRELFGASYRSLYDSINEFIKRTQSEILPIMTFIPSDQLGFAKDFFLPERRLIQRKGEKSLEKSKQKEKEQQGWEWEPQRWSEWEETQFMAESYLYDLFSIVGNVGYGVFPLIIQPFSLAITGRAKNLELTPICGFHCDAVHQRFNAGWTKIVVGANGSIYPNMDCVDFEEMSLGKLGVDSLDTILNRKADFSSRILKYILADGRFFDWDGGICEICKSIKTAKFDF
jgi:hypothetical protein